MLQAIEIVSSPWVTQRHRSMDRRVGGDGSRRARGDPQAIEGHLVGIRVPGSVFGHDAHADSLRDVARGFLHQRLLHLQAFAGREFEVKVGVICTATEGVAENMLELTFGEPIAIEEKATWLRGRRHRRQGS